MQLESKAILHEKIVELLLDEYEEFIKEISRNNWNILANLTSNLNEKIVREFYANPYLLKPNDVARISWVIELKIDYDKEVSICKHNYNRQRKKLETLRGLKKNILPNKVAKHFCIFGKNFELGRLGKPRKILKANMKTFSQIWDTFLFAKIFPSTHVCDVNLDKAKLSPFLIQKVVVDIAEIILNEMHTFVLS